MIYKSESIRIFILIVFFLCLLHLYNITAHASENAEVLTIDEVRLEGDIILIKVTDTATGVVQELEFNLRDYEDGSEYISVQAVDKNGSQSNIVQFKNPYYVPPVETPENPEISITFMPGQIEAEESEATEDDNNGDIDNESVSGNFRPFTPDGTGTVVDNINEDSKEFFSITTEDGNTFYLIIDRHRDTENIYLLNTVTENDLMSLAKDGDVLNGAGMSAIPAPAQPPPETSANITPDEPPPKKSGTTNYILIGVIAVAVGAAAYYFKIIRPKRQGNNNINDFGEEAETMENPDDDREFDSMEDDDDNDTDGGEDDDD